MVKHSPYSVLNINKVKFSSWVDFVLWIIVLLKHPLPFSIFYYILILENILSFFHFMWCLMLYLCKLWANSSPKSSSKTPLATVNKVLHVYRYVKLQACFPFWNPRAVETTLTVEMLEYSIDSRTFSGPQLVVFSLVFTVFFYFWLWSSQMVLLSLILFSFMKV